MMKKGNTASPKQRPVKRAKSEATSAAAQRAQALRERMANQREYHPGTILNKESGWSYAFIPKDANDRVKDMTRLDLETKGYELHTAGIVTVSGFVDAEVWQVPTEIAKELRKIRTERIKRRDTVNSKRNILR